MSALTETLADGAVVAKRNLIKVKRVPELLVFTTIQPIMFILLFAYVFGSAIDLDGIDYREFLIAGIFAQTVVFGATFTGAGIADDMQKGIIDRFRSLPMARSAFLTGRTIADVVYNAGLLVVLMLSGLAVGWRVHDGVLRFLDVTGDQVQLPDQLSGRQRVELLELFDGQDSCAPRLASFMNPVPRHPDARLT